MATVGKRMGDWSTEPDLGLGCRLRARPLEDSRDAFFTFRSVGPALGRFCASLGSRICYFVCKLWQAWAKIARKSC